MTTQPELCVLCVSVYPAEAPSVYHRITAYQADLQARGIRLEVEGLITSNLFRDRRRRGSWASLRKAAMFAYCCLVRLPALLTKVRRYDAIIIQREVFPLGKPWVERLICRLNPNVVYDLDDAIWFAPSNSVNQRKRFWYPNRVSELIAMSRRIVVGNRFLADYARQFHREVHILPTGYDDLGGWRPKSNDAPIIVWIGNVGNACYLQELIPVFRKLAERYPFKLRLIGGDDIFDLPMQGIPVEYLRWQRAAEAEWLLTSDIGIMPLWDMPYEKGKCAFKLIQYFSAGLPVVASPVGINRELIQAENGYLTQSEADWESALSQLIESGELRATLGKNNYRLYQTRYAREVIGQAWYGHLIAAASGKDR